jgi:hypothetical protein
MTLRWQVKGPRNSTGSQHKWVHCFCVPLYHEIQPVGLERCKQPEYNTSELGAGDCIREFDGVSLTISKVVCHSSQPIASKLSMN